MIDKYSDVGTVGKIDEVTPAFRSVAKKYGITDEKEINRLFLNYQHRHHGHYGIRPMR